MPKTPNLDITHIEESQEDKEVTANEAFDALDDAMNSQLPIANSDANQSLTVAQFTRHRSFRFTGATTAARTLTVPAMEREFVVHNKTGNNLTISTGVSPGGEAVTVADEEWAVLSCDAVDVRKVTDRIEHISGHIETPEAKTLTLIESIPYRAMALDATLKTSSGDVTITLQRNGSSITGIASVQAGTVQSVKAATSGNTLDIGERLTMVIAAIGSPTPADLTFTVRLVRL
jgi:hypothetical protein